MSEQPNGRESESISTMVSTQAIVLLLHTRFAKRPTMTRQRSEQPNGRESESRRWFRFSVCWFCCFLFVVCCDAFSSLITIFHNIAASAFIMQATGTPPDEHPTVVTPSSRPERSPATSPTGTTTPGRTPRECKNIHQCYHMRASGRGRCAKCPHMIDQGDCFRMARNNTGHKRRRQHVHCPAPTRVPRTLFETLNKGDICKHSEHLGLFRIEQVMEEDEMVRCSHFLPLESTLLGYKEASKLPFRHVRHGNSDQQLAIKDLTKTDAVVDTKWSWENIRDGSGGWESISYYYRRIINIEEPSTSGGDDSETAPKPEFSGMDLYAGAGGMQLGLAKAGLDVRYSIDRDQYSAQTLKQRNQKGIVYENDAKLLLEEWKKGRCSPPATTIDFLHASPPCQGHSLANNGGCRHNNAKNNDLTLVTADYVEFFRPKVVTVENVIGIMDDTKHDDNAGNSSSRSSMEIFQELVGRLLQLKYQVRVFKVNARDYGDPQYRERLILVAAPCGRPLPTELPKKTHGPNSATQRPFRTALDALDDLSKFPPDNCKYGAIEMMVDNERKLIHNHHLFNETNQERVPPYATQEQPPLEANEPAPTIRCLTPLWHYRLNRMLTPREKARLQGFPDDYVFFGTPQDTYRQIGNAVPVGLASAIGRMIHDTLNADSSS
jgi:DNA (cytosine-5)-methyltransferase 1